MDRKEDRDILRKGGFGDSEVRQLSKLRKDYNEREKRRIAAEQRRFEFIRWLVNTGKLTDQIA